MKRLGSILIPLLCYAQALYSGATVRLVDTIAVRAPAVTLGEIATIDCEDENLRKRLYNLEVSEAPNLGTSRVVSSFRIRALLEKEDISDVEIFGNQSTVTTETEELSSADLRALLDDWIHAELGSEYSSEIDYEWLPKSWTIPKSDSTEIRIKTARKSLSGKVSLTLQAVIDEKVLAHTRARTNISLYTESLVLIRPLERGEKLTEAHLERRKVDVSKMTGMEIAQSEAIVGLVAKRILTVGHVPKISDFEQPILVHRGQPTRIMVINKSIKMSVVGAQALQDGRKGEHILFSNPMNHDETLRAQVVRPGFAVIKLQ